MNSRTIARELSEELRIGIITKKDNKDGLAGICSEASKIFASDPVINKRCLATLSILKPHLEEFRTFDKTKKVDDKAHCDKLQAFKFAVDDLVAGLEVTYFIAVCDALREAMRPDGQDLIRKLTSSLLSDLIDQGWDMASLNRWHRHFLTQQKKAQRSFSNNFDFMLRILQKKHQPFEVILRLSGSERLSEINQVGDFTISGQPGIKEAGSHKLDRFATAHPLTRFARVEIQDVDFTPAAFNARAAFKDQLDLLRFDFERRVVNIEDSCYVKRLGDSKVNIVQAALVVPNPVENIDLDGFNSFVTDVNAVCNRPSIEERSRIQLKAAISQYRFGRDGNSYRDMFLNWWMGLEALAHVDRGDGIGRTVTHNVSKVLAIPYFFRILRDLQSTLKYCEIGWPQGLAEFSGSNELETLTVPQLLKLLQDEKHSKLLAKECQGNPTLAHTINWVSGWMNNPKESAKRFEGHMQNVEWHLQRIYRIRCCIVHGSPIRHRLGLITGNLEFYLKQTILFALKSFHDHDHVRNLEELFTRATLTTERILSALKSDTAGPEAIRDVVFAGVVTTQEPTFRKTDEV